MKESISKFSPGISISIVGIGLVIVGVTGDQNSVFLTAAISIIIAGIVTIINAVGLISNKVSIGVTVVLLVLSGYLGFSNYKSIDEPIQFMKEKQKRYAEVIQNLKDLREIELTYKKENKTFCGSMDTLMDFLMHDSVTMVIKDGDVPDSLNEAQALEMGIIIRDTTMVPAYDVAFKDSYLKERDKKFPLNVEKLRYVPFTDNVEFDINAGEIIRSSGAKVQVFEIKDAAPFDPTDVMQVGSMNEPTTSGNWKEEK